MTAFTKTPPSLADAAWLNEPHLQQVMAAIVAAGGAVRVAGGAVRNALMGVAIADIDLATTMLPDEVMRVCKAAGFGVHPTGIEHGTVTVVNKGVPFEVTTLRHDVETDGRHAVVLFTGDWAEDAKRRDFTMNAMYCDASGKIYDFTDSYADILKHKVRFVGRATERIKEDYLRILRFFRFHAHYGLGTPDKAGLAAVTKLKSGLKHISAERIRAELFKLLVAPRAVPTLKVMAASGVLKIIIPYKDDWRVLGRLPNDPLLRLMAIAKRPLDLKEHLRLANDQAVRIEEMAKAPTLSPKLQPQQQRALLYKLGAVAWRDAAYMNWARGRGSLCDPRWQKLVDLPHRWPIPKFPVTGKDLLAIGVAPGPPMGKMLRKIEKHWIAQDFVPSRAQLLVKFTKEK